jgi:hypothetical protein
MRSAKVSCAVCAETGTDKKKPSQGQRYMQWRPTALTDRADGTARRPAPVGGASPSGASKESLCLGLPLA